MTRKTPERATAGLLISLAMTAPASASLIEPVSSGVGASAYAHLGLQSLPAEDGVRAWDTSTQDQGAELAPLFASVSAVALMPGLDASLEALATVQASWESPHKGRIAFSDVGTIQTNYSDWYVSTGFATAYNNDDVPFNWQYSFRTLEDAFFEFRYAITRDDRTTHPNALGGFQFKLRSPTYNDYLYENTSGLVSLELLAGVTYMSS